MADPQTDVKPDSSTEQTQDSPSLEGNQGAGSDNGVDVKNLRAENQRKTEKIRNLETKLESYESRLGQLESVAQQRNLTAEERGEKSELVEDIRESARKLRQQKESLPWVQVAREEAISSGLNLELERANDFLEDMAADENMSIEELVKEIHPFHLKHSQRRPERRNILAYRDWKKSNERIKSLEDREKALKAKEEEDLRFRETGVRMPRTATIEQEWDKKDSRGRLNSVIDILDNPESLVRK